MLPRALTINTVQYNIARRITNSTACQKKLNNDSCHVGTNTQAPDKDFKLQLAAVTSVVDTLHA
jgi:hypothetical protein